MSSHNSLRKHFFPIFRRLPCCAAHCVSKQKKNVFSLGKQEEGFTLVEVLVAISILAIGLVYIVQSMGQSQTALRLSENIARAAYVAEEEIVKMHLKVLELERLAFGGERGKAEFPGRIMEWETGAEHFETNSHKDSERLNKLIVKVDWQETAKQNTLQIQTLTLDKKKDAFF